MKQVVKEIGKASRQPMSPGEALLSTVVMSLTYLPRSFGFDMLSEALATAGVINAKKIKILKKYDELVAEVNENRHEVGRFLWAKDELC